MPRATAIASRKVQQQEPVKQGAGLLLAVGLGIAFLLFLAFLNTVKSGNVVSETNLLFYALIFYAGAGALYLGFAVSGNDRYMRFASLSTWAGFAANTAAGLHRWYEAGHPPFASVYEMLLSFVWMVALLTLIAEKKYGVKVMGTVTMPLSVVGVVLMQVLHSDVHPLVPALQSTWLHIHVTLAMLSYAACALSFGLAMMFLVQDKMSTESFMAGTSGLATLVYLGILTRFHGGGLNVVAYDFEQKREVVEQGGARLYVTIPDLGWLMALVALVVAVPLVLYVVGRLRNDPSQYELANKAIFIGLALQTIALVAFVLRGDKLAYPAIGHNDLHATSLAASPFILAGLVTGIFGSLLYLMLHWRRDALQAMMPDADTLDRVTYKTIGVAFPLLTLMIAAGAYWANRAWGSYWSWDPKETWALITWLVYAGYLHMRIARGWRGRRAAYFAILGFVLVMFTFFGVTYLLPGLHAYA